MTYLQGILVLLMVQRALRVPAEPVRVLEGSRR